MEHSLENYLKRQPSEVLLLILRSEEALTDAPRYSPEVYSLVRKILEQRQKSTP